MTKLKILLAFGVAMPFLMASSEVTTSSSTVSANDVSAMQKQIADLQKQLVMLTKQMNEIKAKAEQKAEPKVIVVKEAAAPSTTTPVVKESQEKECAPQFDKGYIPVPGTTAAVKVGGLVKLDMIRDTRANTSEQTNVGRLPYALQTRNPNLPNTPMSWKDHYYVHAKQTRLRVDMLVKNKAASDLKAFVEGDFFGATQWGDNFPNNPGNGGQNSNAYNFRLRHAVLSYGGLEAGHTATTFHLDEASLPSIDLNGINGGYGRHALIRYTHKFGGFSVTAAAEHGKADYMTYTATPANATAYHYAYSYQDASGSLSKQERPDLILRLKYNFENSSAVGLSVVNRDLRLANNTAITGNANNTVNGKTYILNVWGVNLAAKIMTFGKDFITGGVISGNGLGWYILDAHGRSALFDPAATSEKDRYKAVKMNMFWVGYSHTWSPQWQTNIGVAKIKFDTGSMSNARRVTRWFEPGLDETYNKFLINTIFSPEDNIQLGLEYFVLERTSTLGYKGLGHRLQFGASYKF